MKQHAAIIILSIAALLLLFFAAAVWLYPYGNNDADEGYSYGISEGLQLVKLADGSLIVEDADGGKVFPIPLRGCTIDTRFRGGKLRFMEKATNRQGYIDRYGIVNFTDNGYPSKYPANIVPEGSNNRPQISPTGNYSNEARGRANIKNPSNNQHQIKNIDVRAIARSNPFYSEAAKILQGKLEESDARHRQIILNYCEHFRTAYTTKDIDFLRQVFSDRALIIVGNVVKTKAKDNDISNGDQRVTYALHTKADYLARLEKVFALNKHIDVRFSDFRILRHPTRDGIYGVTLRQKYKSDRYEDDGWLFLLWDFHNPSMPVIHVRTWQPARTVGSKDDVINMSDFNLE